MHPHRPIDAADPCILQQNAHPIAAQLQARDPTFDLYTAAGLIKNRRRDGVREDGRPGPTRQQTDQ